jgi:hypothetical protein
LPFGIKIAKPKPLHGKGAESLSGLKDMWKEPITLSSPDGEGLWPLWGNGPAGLTVGGWKQEET